MKERLKVMAIYTHYGMAGCGKSTKMRELIDGLTGDVTVLVSTSQLAYYNIRPTCLTCTHHLNSDCKDKTVACDKYKKYKKETLSSHKYADKKTAGWRYYTTMSGGTAWIGTLQAYVSKSRINEKDIKFEDNKLVVNVNSNIHSINSGTLIVDEIQNYNEDDLKSIYYLTTLYTDTYIFGDYLQSIFDGYKLYDWTFDNLISQNYDLSTITYKLVPTGTYDNTSYRVPTKICNILNDIYTDDNLKFESKSLIEGSIKLCSNVKDMIHYRRKKDTLLLCYTNSQADYYSKLYKNVTVSTIHKMQGCEYDTVLIITNFPQKYKKEIKLKKNLVYTALTRAIKNVEMCYDLEESIKLCGTDDIASVIHDSRFNLKKFSAGTEL